MTLLAIGGTFSLLKPAAESGFAHKVWWLWAAFILAIGYNLATSHWVQALQGLNRMRDLQLVYIWGGLGYVLCAMLLLFCKMGLLSMVVATFVKGFITHGRCHQIYRKIVPKADHSPPPDPAIVKKLWPNAYKFGIISVGGYCLSNAPVLICSQFLGKDITASLGLTAQIGNFMMGFAALWLSIKWPEITILRTQGRLNEMAILFGRPADFGHGLIHRNGFDCCLCRKHAAGMERGACAIAAIALPGSIFDLSFATNLLLPIRHAGLHGERGALL